MKLQDYINFYIGCPCIYYMADDDPDGYCMPLDYDIIKLWLANQDETDIKLVLRGLKDMTEEEAIELVKLIVHKDEYINVSTYRHNCTGDLMVQWGLLTPMERANDVEYFINATGERSWSGEQFRYLLEQGFDLFGLIAAGLAIDAKTLQP